MANQTVWKRFPAWAWIVGILIVLGFWGMSVYNGLIQKEGNAQIAWSQVENQYQRRADLVPQLVATVEGAADFERGTITDVTEARTNWLNAQNDPNATVEDQIAASSAFDSAFSRLLVTVEAYPNLTATENFQTLQSQLEGNENRIAVARQDYNAAAGVLNIAIRRFPTNILAGLFGFDGMPLFEAAEGSEEAPEVKFDFSE